MKVFIVDDTSFIRIICRYHLQNEGFQVVGEAYDGAQAEQDICAAQPDCVIMDLALPSKNGAEVIRDVQAKFPHIAFVILSALDEDMLTATAPDIVYSSFVKKPFDASVLMAAVRDAIQNNVEKKAHG